MILHALVNKIESLAVEQWLEDEMNQYRLGSQYIVRISMLIYENYMKIGNWNTKALKIVLQAILNIHKRQKYLRCYKIHVA